MSEAAGAYLDWHLATHPVDATFIGDRRFDHLWPRADARAAADEQRDLAAFAQDLTPRPPGDGVTERLDRAIASAEVAQARSCRPRWHNPAWVTGEAAFGIIGLLLPQSEPVDHDALRARLVALPDFLADGRARLTEAGAAPRGWTDRAVREARTAARLLVHGLPLHPVWDAAWAAPAQHAADALLAFADAVARLPDAPFAAGAAWCDVLLRHVHGFDFGVADALRDAAAAMEESAAHAEQLAAAVAPGATVAEAVAIALSDAPPPALTADTYRRWHDSALAQADTLLAPATDYSLDFRWLPPWCAAAAEALYFLSYRCPPALRPGSGSVYWVPQAAGATPHAVIRSTHAIHHGSIGHHTQNARARAASSAFGRVAGTDCAMGIAFLSAGTMVEGWACHAQDLMLELDGFGSPGDRLLQCLAERRNAASVLVDLRLHTGEWTAAQAERFYIDDAGFPAARAPKEVVRNSMFPTSRAMYWLGTREIRRLRARFPGTARAFHDTLIGFGHVPVALAGRAMARAGLLA